MFSRIMPPKEIQQAARDEALVSTNNYVKIVSCNMRIDPSLKQKEATYQVKMDDPNITMKEYIRLEEEKACRRGKVYNWETATYANMPVLPSSEPMVSYFDDFDYFKDFENEFPAIAYNDALTSKLDFSEPTVSPQHIDEFDET
ncbi:hypothetical protein Tco_1071302, partial [Tanacetum coccineum]